MLRGPRLVMGVQIERSTDVGRTNAGRLAVEVVQDGCQVLRKPTCEG